MTSARLDSLLLTADLPPAELQAARLDGEVYAVAEAYLASDAPPTASARGRALRAYLPGRVIAERHTAAWLWGAAPLLSPHWELCAGIEARVRPSSVRPHRLREVTHSPGEVVRRGGMPVTTPLRTVLDLLRSEDVRPDDRAIVRELLTLGALTTGAVVAALESRRNLPGRTRALARFAEVVESQPALTR